MVFDHWFFHDNFYLDIQFANGFHHYINVVFSFASYEINFKLFLKKLKFESRNPYL